MKRHIHNYNPASSLSILLLQQYLCVKTTKRKTVPMLPTPPQKPRTPPSIALNSSDSGQDLSNSTTPILALLSAILLVIFSILTVLVAITTDIVMNIITGLM